MADTIRRLQAYEAAGADVLYAPGLRTLAEVRDVVGAVKRPFNVVTGWLDPDITLRSWRRPAPSGSASAARCRGSRWPVRRSRPRHAAGWFVRMDAPDAPLAEMRRMYAEGAGTSK